MVQWGDEEPLFQYRMSKKQGVGDLVRVNERRQWWDTFLLFDPGTQYHYGMSHDYLGFVVDHISGLTIEDYVSKHITGPLGMKNTSDVFAGDDHLRSHSKQDGRLTAWPPTLPVALALPTVLRSRKMWGWLLASK